MLLYTITVVTTGKFIAAELRNIHLGGLSTVVIAASARLLCQQLFPPRYLQYSYRETFEAIQTFDALQRGANLGAGERTFV
jgi:hypothetical protein